MSLRWKFLVPLNALILAVWVGHFWKTASIIEEDLIRSEMDAIEHLALGLKFSIEHMLRRGEDIAREQEYLTQLTDRCRGLDIMVIDSEFQVHLASDSPRIGKKWYEHDIEEVLAGKKDEAWNLRGHFHDGRPAIDATIGVLDAAGRVRYVVHIARWLDALENAEREQLLSHLISALVMLIAVAVALNALTYRLVIRPIHSLRRKIAASGWFEEHPSHRRKGEIEQLSTVVGSLLESMRCKTDSLVDTIEQKQDALDEVSEDRQALMGDVERVTGELEDARQRMIRLEKLTAQGQLSAGLAHELRNPLHTVRATAETARRRFPVVSEMMNDIVEEVDRIERLLEKLMSYTHSTSLQRELVDLEKLCTNVERRVCRGQRHHVAQPCDRCRVQVAPHVREIEADPVLVEQAVMNLCLNSAEATSPYEEISLSATSDGENGLVITVSDRGRGLDRNEENRVFEPFFTRKAGGTGLGLSMVQKIADLHGGSISLENRKNGGTIARLHIPNCLPRGSR
jgi:two-component system, NtrC family, sensor histidine kinase HydH